MRWTIRLGHDETLSGIELDGTVFKVDEQLALDDVEKLVVHIVLVPVILTLKNAQANNRIIHLAERLVVPLECAGVGSDLAPTISSGLYRMLRRVS